MNKDQITALVQEDLGKKIKIKTVVIQDLIWPGHIEIRAYTDNGEAFSALYENNDKVSKFVPVPKDGGK